MKRSLSFITFLILTAVVAAFAATPFCHIRHYDEYDGLSQRQVKQIAKDSDGVLWFATWNGLNRFDGYKFEHIRPQIDDEARSYSERFRDIKPASTGGLWCRIDDKILYFNLSTHRFTDIHSQLEKKLATAFDVSQIQTATDGRTVLKCADGRYILLSDSNPVESAAFTDERPKLKYHSPGTRKLDNVGGYRNEDLLYSRADSTGTAWLITRDGTVLSAPSAAGPYSTIARIDAPDGSLTCCTIDLRGNIWLRSNDGAFCLTLGQLPYTYLAHPEPSIVRGCVRDPKGRIWISYSDSKAVAVYSDLSAAPRYLGSDGHLHDSFVSFGSPIYSMSADPQGNMWFGSKPDGLFRLTPQSADAYSVTNFRHDPAKPGLTPAANDIYDIIFDRQGRMWLATMRKGIDCVLNPTSVVPEFIHLGQFADYPQNAVRVRRLAIIGDSLITAATTGGFLTVGLPAEKRFDRTSFRLHVSRPGDDSSLGNIAVMNILPDAKGRLFIATESDGVNMLPPEISADSDSARFVHFDTRTGMPVDVALSLAPTGSADDILVVSNKMIYTLDPLSGRTVTYPASFWHRHMHFSEAAPLRLGDNRWLLGLEDGAISVNLDRADTALRPVPPVIFTSVALQNRPDSLISARTDSIILSPDERNITINFAALDYGSTEDLQYQFSMDDSDWNNLGTNRSVTFLDMDPGEYRLHVRSSDSSGNWLDNTRTLTLIVTPTFWETPAAYVLYILAILLIIVSVTWTIVYIRRMKRKQKELLAAYLRLVDSHTESAEFSTPPDSAPQQQQQPSTATLSPADEAFMGRVMDFINQNLGNPDAGIDDMAAATATSRSSLNRKMKSLLGVTPADFFKESRISRAATLLSETDRPIKEIALDCGFSDLNYFGKCFKAARKTSPTAYRREHRTE